MQKSGQAPNPVKPCVSVLTKHMTNPIFVSHAKYVCGSPVKDESRSELADEFLLFVSTLFRGMGAIFRRMMEEYDVTWPQFHMLKMVWHSDRMTVTELSNSLMIAAPTASRMIDGLCAKGLLEKAKDPCDQRVALIRLTPKSEMLLLDLRELQNKVVSEVLEGEDTEELQRNIRSLSRIAGKWQATVEKTARKGATDE